MEETRKLWLYGNTLSHRKAFTRWEEFEQRTINGTGIDAFEQNQNSIRKKKLARYFEKSSLLYKVSDFTKLGTASPRRKFDLK